MPHIYAKSPMANSFPNSNTQYSIHQFPTKFLACMNPKKIEERERGQSEINGPCKYKEDA
ncbi:hypothetical protein KFK09_014295 [Dendrobium nobile]|uniref:Uncharacterized protein n=1 Tax=Dendrobium nobile TaxID=94219 RepID=A0A8T3BBN7_DENNO|nr:hypothetical protein KFK09_014295 [Dendrobium nobile]